MADNDTVIWAVILVPAGVILAWQGFVVLCAMLYNKFHDRKLRR